MTKMADLDRFDRALLAEMQHDNQTPARILAERVGLSQSAVLRRLRRLRADGIITADISIVNPAVLGVPVTIHVLVSLVRGSQLADEFARKLSSRPEIRQASYVTGGADFVLHLQVESMEAYAAFAREVFHDDPNVSTFYTYVAMREVVGPLRKSEPGGSTAKQRPRQTR
jgi:DNA-binding Lrp family transcriptional regulator